MIYFNSRSLLPWVLLLGFTTSVFAQSNPDDGWETVKSTNDGYSNNDASAAANDEWVDVPVKDNVKAHFSDAHSGNNASQQKNSLTLKELDEIYAEPLIVDYGEQGSGSENPPSAEPATNTTELTSASTESLAQPEINLDMFIGQLLVLGKVDVTRVAIGNGGIVRAEILKTNELLVIGQQEGSTSLRLWNKDNTQTAYNIRVGKNDPETRIHMERMVRLRVRMVEFNKRAIGELGIDWGDVANGPSFSAAGDAISNNLFRPAAEGFDGLPLNVDPFATYFGIATNVTSKINFLSGNGDAVTLAEPVLSAVNGGQASFLAGGEIPFPAVGENGQTTIEFKEYGVRLQVAPTIDSGGNIRTFVETEISRVDVAVSVNGTPGLLTRRAQTEVNVRSGETIVLAGLLSSDESNDVSGIPGLRNLPILGRFFSTKGKSTEVRELVIFITPEVIDPQALMEPSNKNIYEKALRRSESARSSLPLME